jgi:hypothetical protein
VILCSNHASACGTLLTCSPNHAGQPAPHLRKRPADCPAGSPEDASAATRDPPRRRRRRRPPARKPRGMVTSVCTTQGPLVVDIFSSDDSSDDAPAVLRARRLRAAVRDLAAWEGPLPPGEKDRNREARRVSGVALLRVAGLVDEGAQALEESDGDDGEVRRHCGCRLKLSSECGVSSPCIHPKLVDFEFVGCLPKEDARHLKQVRAMQT